MPYHRTVPSAVPNPGSKFGRYRLPTGVEEPEEAPPEQTLEPPAANSRWEIGAHVALVAVAAVMRLWDLGSRAMHHDESLHAYFSWQLATGKGFQHDPLMHGPLQFEVNAAIFFLFGDSDVTARLFYAVMGAALVALPYFFRRRLGVAGAIIVAALLAFSPSMLYFSRFTRNDILMAFFTLALVISMWRYLAEGRNRFLYIGAAALALAFSSKETTFIVAGTLGLYLTIVVVSGIWTRTMHRVSLGGMAPGTAAGRLAGALWAEIRSTKPAEISRPAVFLLLLVTLSLPQWSALVSVLQDTPILSWSNIVLARGVGAGGPIGVPTGGGIVLAFVVVVVLLGASMYVGFRWRWSVWWRAALIFYIIWVLLHTTFFTNIVGVGSGTWQSLGYWLAQQGETRGNQPWYYYFVIAPIYEFLPLLFAIAGGVYYVWRRDRLGVFLGFWSVTTFFAYTVAGEKMPWLLVGIVLPLIVLAGRFLGDLVGMVRVRGASGAQGALILAGVPLMLVGLWVLLLIESDGESSSQRIWGLIAFVAAANLLGAAWMWIRDVKRFAALAAIPVAVILLVLTVRASWYASYRNGDVPVEMIIYTQTSPDIVEVARQIEAAGGASGLGKDVSITIDSTSGFAWPWAWYLRNYTSVEYPTYGGDKPEDTPDSSILLVHRNNRLDADEVLEETFTDGVLVRHRWWFPEETYRGLTPQKFFKAFADRKTWRTAMDYFLYRKLDRGLGSEDSYFYAATDFPVIYEPVDVPQAGG